MTEVKVSRAQQRIMDRERRAADLAAGRKPAPSAEALQKKAMRAAQKKKDAWAAAKEGMSREEHVERRALIDDAEVPIDTTHLVGTMHVEPGEKAVRVTISRKGLEDVAASHAAKVDAERGTVTLQNPVKKGSTLTVSYDVTSPKRKTKVIPPRGVKLDQTRTASRAKPAKAERGAIVAFLREMKIREVKPIPSSFDPLALRVAATRMRTADPARYFITWKDEKGVLQVKRLPKGANS